MLTSCLIFLYTGMFAACMPTTKPPGEVLKTLNQEIQNRLEAIINHTKKQVVTKSHSNMMAPIPVSTKEEQCAKLRLKAFIQLLNQWNFESHEEMTEMLDSLKEFEKKWTPQQKSDQNCETEEYVHREFRKVLVDLRKLMIKLFCIQEKC